MKVLVFARRRIDDVLAVPQALDPLVLAIERACGDITFGAGSTVMVGRKGGERDQAGAAVGSAGLGRQSVELRTPNRRVRGV